MDKEELEQNVEYYAKRAKSAESHIVRQNERIADLEKEIAELKKACDETQELLDKQIEVTYKLHKENTELKETVTKMNNVITETFSNLTKAKELLQRVVKWATTETCKCEKFDFILADAKQFLNSEVEK